jgi:hypothetical protein
MHKTQLAALVVLVSVALTLLAGCGNVGPSGPPRVEPGGVVEVPGDGPVDTLIAIDETALVEDDGRLGQDDRAASLAAAEPTITRGGTVSVVVFGRVGGKAVNLYTQPIKTRGQLGKAARDDDGQRAALAAALDVAVGLKPPPDDAKARLKDVVDGPGTDLARVVRDALTGLSGDIPATVFIATDGLVDQPELKLARVLKVKDPRAAGDELAKRITPPYGSRKRSLLWIRGLGSTAGRPAPGGAALDELVEAWRVACRRIAQHCEIDT